ESPPKDPAPARGGAPAPRVGVEARPAGRRLCRQRVVPARHDRTRRLRGGAVTAAAGGAGAHGAPPVRSAPAIQLPGVRRSRRLRNQMGLLSGLLSLPLLPVRGAFWAIGQVADAADRQVYGPAMIRRQLMELARKLDAGTISAEGVDA